TSDEVERRFTRTIRANGYRRMLANTGGHRRHSDEFASTALQKERIENLKQDDWTYGIDFQIFIDGIDIDCSDGIVIGKNARICNYNVEATTDLFDDFCSGLGVGNGG